MNQKELLVIVVFNLTLHQDKSKNAINMSTKNLLLLFLFPITLFIMNSCDDTQLAKDADGRWEGTFRIKDEYGTPQTQKVEYEFKYIEDNLTDGGEFTQTYAIDCEEQEDGINVKYTVKTEIKGTWEVIINDMYLTYNLSSLEVSIENLQCNAPLWLAGGSEAVSEEIRKNVYKSLYDEYETSNDEGYYFAGLEVTDDKLSFETSDIGRMEFERVK